MSNTCIKDHNDQTVSKIKNNHRRFFFFIPAKLTCLVLLSQGEGAVQR